MDYLTAVRKTLTDAVSGQMEKVARWHAEDPSVDPELGDGEPQCLNADALRRLILMEHAINFRLWHVEDEARRMDVGPEIIADCKRRIDSLNQRRNDYIEKIDMCLARLVTPHLPEPGPNPRHNTETMGSVLDRLSILSLKIFHMREQTLREDAGPEHVERCRGKLERLEEQREGLRRAGMELMEEYARGEKHPNVNYQFKMYNDPALNPALYGGK